MLKEITWGQFWSVIAVVAGVYYLYVALKYYRAELLGWVTGWGGQARDSVAGDKGEDGAPAQGEVAPKAAADQAELFEGARPIEGKGGNVQFEMMQQAIGMIRKVIAQGIENKLDRENVLDHIREVLSDYRKLRKTEYAETINNFLIRILAAELSLELGEQELAALWK